MSLSRVIALSALLLVACDEGRESESAAGAPGKPRTEAADVAMDRGPLPLSDAPSPLSDDAMPDRAESTLTLRGQHLLEAISKNSPDLATDFVFPRDAYVIARDDKDPARAWDDKLKPQFEKTIRFLSRRIKGLDRAVFVSFEVGKRLSRVVPKKRDWKMPLFEVKHSSLAFTVDGKAQKIDIAEMISWRGSWYVTKVR